MTTFQLEAPDALPGAVEPDGGRGLTAEERAVLDDDSADRDAIGRELIGVERVARLALAEVQSEAEAKFAADPDIETLRGVGKAFREAWQTHDAKVAEITRRSDLSQEGKNTERQRAAETRDAAVQRIASDVLAKLGDSVLARYPREILRAPTADVSAEVSTIHGAYAIARPVHHLRQVLDTLHIAQDRGAEPAARWRANVLLERAYLPAVDRRAHSPEPYAAKWSEVYGGVADAISTHLDGVNRAPLHWGAAELVERARADFTWLHRSATHIGRWEVGALETGAPAFDWR